MKGSGNNTPKGSNVPWLAVITGILAIVCFAIGGLTNASAGGFGLAGAVLSIVTMVIAWIHLNKGNQNGQ
jgi:hypothetical protein